MKAALAILLMAVAPAFAADNEVMAADRAFSALSVEKGVPYAFWFYASKNARLYGPSGPPVIGRDAKPPTVEKTDSTLSWVPTAGSQDGKLGWTDGEWKLTSARGTRTGHYVTVWVKEAGQWKVQADIGTFDPPPSSAAKTP